MKWLLNFLLLLALALIIFNCTQLKWDHLFEKQSIIPMIGIVAATCALLVLWLFKLSKKINDQVNR
ncbi:MAG: hypothetical protein CFE24_04760 [Flavobacterium sp. BFFFF2]|nr:MAG: hypothetical protein CFE24_04760 [Flavobacterium sp. BFFFF2]